MIAIVFAQVSPVDWQLAEARVIDVAVGAGVGVLIGLLAWPRGGSGELHRAAGTLPRSRGQVVRETVTVARRERHRRERAAARPRRGVLADASYALYQTERHPSARIDWQATLVAGHHAVRGAEALAPRAAPPGCLLPCRYPLTSAADDVAGCYERRGHAA